MSIVVHILHDGRHAHAVQHSKVELQGNRQHIMLHATANHGNPVWQCEVVSTKCIAAQVLGTQRHEDQRMEKRKSTRVSSFHDAIEVSAEAVLCSEDPLCVRRLIESNARCRQRQHLSCVWIARHKVHVQTQVTQERRRLKFQQVRW